MKVEKMKESRRRLSWLPKAALVALLGASIAVVGCKSGSDDDDDDPPKSYPPPISDNKDPDYPVSILQKTYDDKECDWTSDDTSRYTVTAENGYVQVSAVNNGGNGTAASSSAFGIPASTDFKATFDIQLTAGNDPATGSAYQLSSLELYDNNGVAYTIKVQEPSASTKWGIYAGTTTDNTPPNTPCITSESLANIVLEKETWYTVTLISDETDGTSIAINAKDGATVLATKKLSDDPMSGFDKLKFKTARYSAAMAFDNLYILGKQDIPVISTAKIDVTNNVTAIAADDDEKTDDIPNTVTLTANVDAAYASDADKEVSLTYEWSLSDEDKTYATLTPAEDGKTATLTGNNTTIYKKDVTVSLKVSAGSGASAVTKSTDAKVTVNAKQSLLTLSLIEEKTVTSGEAFDITVMTTLEGYDEVEEKPEIIYEWESKSTAKATVKQSDSDKSTATVTTKAATEANSPVAITVTVTVGDIQKTAICNLTINKNTSALTGVTIEAKDSDTAELVYGLASKERQTLTAIVTPNGADANYNWKSSDSTKLIVTPNDENHAEAVITFAEDYNLPTNGSETVIVTVTAYQNNDTNAGKQGTISVTLRKPKESVVFERSATSSPAYTEPLFTGAYVNNWQTNERLAFSVDNYVESIKRSGDGKYAAALTGNQTTNTLHDIDDGTDFVLEFDLQLPFTSNDLYIANGQGFPFTVNNSNPINGAVINTNIGFLLQLKYKQRAMIDGATDYNGCAYNINLDAQPEGETALTINLLYEQWYTVKVERIGTDTYLTITPKDNTTTGTGLTRRKIVNKYEAGGLGQMILIADGEDKTTSATAAQFANIKISTLD